MAFTDRPLAALRKERARASEEFNWASLAAARETMFPAAAPEEEELRPQVSAVRYQLSDIGSQISAFSDSGGWCV